MSRPPFSVLDNLAETQGIDFAKSFVASFGRDALAHFARARTSDGGAHAAAAIAPPAVPTDAQRGGSAGGVSSIDAGDAVRAGDGDASGGALPDGGSQGTAGGAPAAGVRP